MITNNTVTRMITYQKPKEIQLKINSRFGHSREEKQRDDERRKHRATTKVVENDSKGAAMEKLNENGETRDSASMEKEKKKNGERKEEQKGRYKTRRERIRISEGMSDNKGAKREQKRVNNK